jgi:hypothetical protein
MKTTHFFCYGCSTPWDGKSSVYTYVADQDQPTLYVIGYRCGKCHMTWVGVPENAESGLTRIAQQIHDLAKDSS